MGKYHVLLTSDLHCTDLEDWYGIRDEVRMERWLEDVLNHETRATEGIRQIVTGLDTLREITVV